MVNKESYFVNIYFHQCDTSKYRLFHTKHLYLFIYNEIEWWMTVIDGCISRESALVVVLCNGKLSEENVVIVVILGRVPQNFLREVRFWSSPEISL